MEAEVTFKSQSVSEACTADGACVRPLSCMDPLMNLQMVLAVKVSSTYYTMVWSWACGKHKVLGSLVIVELRKVDLLSQA